MSPIERIPPSDRQAEQSVLGSMLRDNEQITDVVAEVVAPDFYTKAHELVFQAIVELYVDRHHPVDLVTLAESLHAKRYGTGNCLEEAGGAAYLTQLWDAAPVVSNVLYYAQIVKAKSVLRRISKTAREMERAALSQTEPAEEILAGAERSLAEIQNQRFVGDVVHIRVAVSEALEAIDRKATKQEGDISDAIPTPWADLNRMTGGLPMGQLIVVAARPSVGKTMLACNLIAHAADAGARMFFASLEQSRVEVSNRFMALRTRFHSMKFRKGVFSGEEVPVLSEKANEVREFKLWIDDRSNQTATRIGVAARRLQQKHGLDMIVVDYLQIVEPEERKNITRADQVSRICRQLKTIAKEMKIPVVALAQLNRDNDKTGRRPRISDLKESGQIEQEADLVLLLHKEDEDQKADEETLEVIVGKQRDGPRGTVYLTHCKRWFELKTLVQSNSAERAV